MKNSLTRVFQAFSLFAIIAVCSGCGSNQDYSNDHELTKSQGAAGQAATAAPNGAKAHPAMMVPQQRHP